MVNYLYISFTIIFLIKICSTNVLKTNEDNVFKPEFNNDHDISKEIPQNLTSSRCETSIDQVNCSLIVTYPIQFSAGFSLKYIRSRRPEVDYTIFLNEHIGNGTFSVADPPKECIFPFKFANVCVKLYNFGPNIPECISGCVAMQFRLLPFKANANLGCFIIPLKKNYDREQCGSSNRNEMSTTMVIISLIIAMMQLKSD